MNACTDQVVEDLVFPGEVPVLKVPDGAHLNTEPELGHSPSGQGMAAEVDLSIENLNCLIRRPKWGLVLHSRIRVWLDRLIQFQKLTRQRTSGEGVLGIRGEGHFYCLAWGDGDIQPVEAHALVVQWLLEVDMRFKKEERTARNFEEVV